MNAQTKLDLASELVSYHESIVADCQKNHQPSAYVVAKYEAIAARTKLLKKWSSNSSPRFDEQWADLLYRMRVSAVRLAVLHRSNATFKFSAKADLAHV